MKISTPILPKQPEVVAIEDLLSGELEDALLNGAEEFNSHVVALDLSGVLIEHCQLTSAQFERCSARDLLVKQTDVSAANMSNAGINRAEFINCRMEGIDFSRTSLHDVTFKGCKLNMVNFRFADLRRVAFIDCFLDEADFLSARLVDVIFEASNLKRAIFDSVSCVRVDLRTSEIDEVVGWKSLKGAMIDTTQLMSIAPYLAHELGIKVG